MSFFRKLLEIFRGGSRPPRQIPTPTGWNPEVPIPPHVPGAGADLPPLPPKPEPRPGDEI